MLTWGKRKKRLLAAGLVMLLVFAAGCQAVAGVELNDVLKNALKVSSMEGTQSVGLQLRLKDEALADVPAEEAAIISMLTNMKLEMTDIKVRDENHASFTGAISLGESRIGFSLSTADNLTVLQAEGLRKPIELDLTSSAIESLLSDAGLDAAELDTAVPSADVQQEVKAIGESLIDIVGGYAIDNLPNPTSLSVTPATETVGGESLALMKVHAELNGKELWQWAGSYLDALLADEDGIKEMLTALIELAASHEGIWEKLGQENPFGEMPAGEEKDEAIQDGVDQVVDALIELRDEYKAADPSDIETIFNEQSSVKADLFVDTKLDIRKQQVELTLKPLMPADAAAGEDDVYADSALGAGAEAASVLEGITLTYAAESWNVNGAVTPAAPQHVSGALTPDQLFGMEGYEMLRQLDAQSALYDVLRNKLHIGKQEVTLIPGYDPVPPIVTPDGRTLIPLRSVAEELGAMVTITPDKKLRLYDDATGTTIDMQLGSAAVKVNGTPAKWSYPATRLANGITYVPARDLITQLQGSLAWAPLWEDSDEQALRIDREVG